MAREIRWEKRVMQSEAGEIVDSVGFLGPLEAFTLYQVLDDRRGWLNEWKLTSHFIPSKRRNACFGSIDDGQRACEVIVSEFAKWLSK